MDKHTDMYLELKRAGGAVPGESTDKENPGWIAIHSFDIGMTQPVTMGSNQENMTAGRVSISHLSVTKTVDKSSHELALACCTGETFKSLTLRIHEAAGKRHKYWEYFLENVVVAGYDPSCNGGSTRFTEVVTFAFGKIKWTYTMLGNGGQPGESFSHGWDLEQNTQTC